jgi:hypothetical protein
LRKLCVPVVCTLLFVPLLAAPAPALAAVCAVPGSYATIQSALNDAGCATIQIAAGTFNENLVVSRSVILQGAGASTTIIDGGYLYRVVTITSPVSGANTVTIANVTIQHGAGVIHGGGILNGDWSDGTSGATLTILNSVVTANHAGFGGGGGTNQVGGGIVSIAPTSIINSTISNNSSDGDAGGMALYNGAPGTIVNSTFSGNTAGATECCGFGAGLSNGGSLTVTNSTISGNHSYVGYGGGIGNGGPLTLSFTTIANNSGSIAAGLLTQFGPPVTVKNSLIVNNSGGPDCDVAGLVASLGGNFDSAGACGFTSASVNLGPLQVNAPGTTATHALTPPSAAFDAAVDCKDAGGTTLTTDQRGVARPQGAACDSGAFEVVVVPTPAQQVVALTVTVASLGMDATATRTPLRVSSGRS